MTNTNTSVMELSSTPPVIYGWETQVAERPAVILVVPDVHEAIGRLEVLLAHAGARYEVIRTVFLGDWWDSWTSTYDSAARTLEWLLERFITHPQDEFLLGNHDIPYLYPQSLEWSMCSGFHAYTAALVSHALPILQARFKLETDAFGWLCTHAGFAKNNHTPHASRDALTGLALSGAPAILQAGQSRGGTQAHGGVTWQDWAEFEPVEGLRQVVGHTQSKHVRWKHNNVCIDTKLCHYAVIAPDSRLATLEVPDASHFL